MTQPTPSHATAPDLRAVQLGSCWRSAGHTLTEAELDLACRLSTDHHPVHTDAAYAARSPAGQRVFHGGYGVMLGLGLATAFPDVGRRTALALGVEAWRFAAPLHIGDTVHVEVEITGLRRTSDGRRLLVHKQVRLVKQTGETAHEGTAGAMVWLDAAHGDLDNEGEQT